MTSQKSRAVRLCGKTIANHQKPFNEHWPNKVTSDTIDTYVIHFRFQNGLEVRGCCCAAAQRHDMTLCRMHRQVALLVLLGAATLLAAPISSSSKSTDKPVSLTALHKFATTIDDQGVCKRGGFHWHGDCCSACPTDLYFVDGACAPREG